MDKQIRVMIVDDHDVVRRGLSLFLSGFDDLLLVGEASNGTDAIQLCGQLQPDVVLMDMVMPDMDGISVTREIRANYPTIQVVILTGSKEDELVQGALQAGAIGYLLKNASVAQMAATIRSAYNGQPSLSVEATQSLINLTLQARTPTPTYNLTPREQTILELMVEGLNNQEIADRLFVSRATVKAGVSTILSKLGVPNRIDAVRLALRESLVK
jgi:two-component system, NarL family, response regulator LiaR